MPSKPCEKLPGSNKTVVDSPESPLKFASRHEWPKCVNSMSILWRRRGTRGGDWAVRLMRVVALATWGLVIAPSGVWPAGAVPGACPPICDAIPDAAWVDSTAVPLYTVYLWPALAGFAVTAPSARFGFEAVCGSSPIGEDPRAYAVG